MSPGSLVAGDVVPGSGALGTGILISSLGCAGSALPCRLSLVAASQGYPPVVLHGLLIAGPSLAAEHGLVGAWVSEAVPCRLSSWGSQAELHCSTRGLSRLGIEPISPALAGRFFTTKQSRKPKAEILHHKVRSLGLYHFSIRTQYSR